ncbi:hypothetical protein Ddc_15645 [Ditylenchus destructor]|nr:hypothetical protein Ddc_15645 [Ditylenchus destructor]
MLYVIIFFTRKRVPLHTPKSEDLSERLPEAINPETWNSSSARPVPIASSHREEAIGVSHAPIRGPIRKLAPPPNPGFSGLPEAINPETWKSSSARPVPIASSHREEAIGVSHAQIRGPIRKLALGPNPGFSGLPEAINPETWKSSSARPVPIASSHREEAIGVSHAQIRGPIRKLALGPNPGFSGLPEAINPETWNSSSARPVPIASSHREEAIGLPEAINPEIGKVRRRDRYQSLRLTERKRWCITRPNPRTYQKVGPWAKSGIFRIAGGHKSRNLEHYVGETGTNRLVSPRGSDWCITRPNPRTYQKVGPRAKSGIFRIAGGHKSRNLEKFVGETGTNRFVSPRGSV